MGRRARSVNLGINFSILRSKVNGSFEYYYKKTSDLITQREIPYENGEHSMYVNGGNMKNSGWDLSFSLVPGGSTAVRCTECGCKLTVSEFRLNKWNYCPNCGAKMDGDAENVRIKNV